MVDRRSYQAGAASQKGFTVLERRAFLHGEQVLWKDSGKWNPGKVVGSIRKDATKREYITVQNTGGRTKNVETGEVTRAYPGSVKPA